MSNMQLAVGKLRVWVEQWMSLCQMALPDHLQGSLTALHVVVFIVGMIVLKLLGVLLLGTIHPKEARQLKSWLETLERNVDVETPRLWKLYFADSTFD